MYVFFHKATVKNHYSCEPDTGFELTTFHTTSQCVTTKPSWQAVSTAVSGSVYSDWIEGEYTGCFLPPTIYPAQSQEFHWGVK